MNKTTIKDKKISIIENNQPLPYYPPLCDSFDGEKELISVNGTNLYIEKLGSGVPILFIHGGPGSSHHYFHNTFEKEIEGIQMIFYDQRGCFKSEYNASHKYSIKEAVEDIDGIRRTLGIEKWYVLGHSFGGLLAQIYKRDYPDSILGVILVSSAHGLQNSGIKKTGEKYLSKMELKRIEEIDNDNSITLQENIYNSFLNGDWKRQNYYKPSDQEMYYSATYEWNHDEDFNEMVSQDMEQYDLTGMFEKNNTPTLIIEGEEDPTWEKSKLQLLTQNHPGSILKIIKNASHEPFKDNTKVFCEDLKEFIKATK